jgi:hypothetical protein
MTEQGRPMRTVQTRARDAKSEGVFEWRQDLNVDVFVQVRRGGERGRDLCVCV